MRVQSDPLTPLIDVLFTVLIALAVFVNPEEPEQVKVPTLSEASGTESVANDSTPLPLIEVASDGSVQFDGKPVEIGSLSSCLPAPSQGQRRKVQFRAHPECLYQVVFSTRDRITQQGIDVIEIGEIVSEE